jgi:hypothetical protein
MEWIQGVDTLDSSTFYLNLSTTHFNLQTYTRMLRRAAVRTAGVLNTPFGRNAAITTSRLSARPQTQISLAYYLHHPPRPSPSRRQIASTYAMRRDHSTNSKSEARPSGRPNQDESSKENPKEDGKSKDGKSKDGPTLQQIREFLRGCLIVIGAYLFCEWVQSGKTG